MSKSEDDRSIVCNIVESYGARRYVDGYMDGLEVAERIAKLFTHKPSTPRMDSLNMIANAILDEARNAATTE